MKCSRGLNRLLIAGLVATAVAAPLAQVAHAKPHPPAVPGAISVGAGHKPFLVGKGVGVQIYSCATTATGYGWNFVAPRANLYGKNGTLLTTHFGGPTWQANDGSKVIAQREDGVTVDPTAVPWLLLSTVSTEAGPDGDRLTKTTYIQRTATTGGLAPAVEECNAATVGTIEEVPYTADYTFWKQTGG